MKRLMCIGTPQVEWGRELRRKMREAGILTDVVVSGESRVRELAGKRKDIDQIRRDIRMRAGK